MSACILISQKLLEYKKLDNYRPMSGYLHFCSSAQKSCDLESWSPPLRDLGIKPTALHRPLHSIMHSMGQLSAAYPVWHLVKSSPAVKIPPGDVDSV